jgi:hypothetical protein
MSNNSERELRAALAEHSDELIYTIDLDHARRTRENMTISHTFRKKYALAQLDQHRERLVKEVREVERVNLQNLNELLAVQQNRSSKANTVIGPQDLFKQFCFVLTMGDIIRLFITDRVIPKPELELLQSLVHDEIPNNKGKVFLNIRDKTVEKLFDGMVFEKIDVC